MKPSFINPAYVGVDGIMKVTFMHRSQWIGVAGAPVTQTLLFSAPLGQHVGFGFGITRDQIGPANETNVSADVSYTLHLNNNGLDFSFGIKGGLQLLNVDYTKLIIQNPNDPSIFHNINSRITPNIGAGMYLFNQDWYVGLSMPNLLSTKHYNEKKVSLVSRAVHFYLLGGINFYLNDNLKMKPTFLLKNTSTSPLTIDLSLNFLFHNRFTTGVSYRQKASVSGLVDFKVSTSISIGYSYDYDTSDIGNFSGGSHEVLVRYYFNEVINNVSEPDWLF